jgi:hypothetical protein
MPPDPVLGLTRRTILALAFLLVAGVGVSTAVTWNAVGEDPACPDTEAGCLDLGPAEPVLVGVLAGTDGTIEGVRRATAGARIHGHPVDLLAFRVACSVESAAEAARELHSDPPDGPPVVVAVGDPCPEASLPAGQFLSDSGIPFVTTAGPAVGENRLSVPFYIRDEAARPEASAARAVEAISRLAVPLPDGRLLIPKGSLRALLAS